MAEPNEYDLQREERIRRNKAMLAKLQVCLHLHSQVTLFALISGHRGILSIVMALIAHLLERCSVLYRSNRRQTMWLPLC